MLILEQKRLNNCTPHSRYFSDELGVQILVSCKNEFHFAGLNSTLKKKILVSYRKFPKSELRIKAVVLGIFLHAERKSNLRVIFGS